MLRNTKFGYGSLAILFHWTMAILIIGMLGLGLYMVRQPLTAPETFALFQWHKSFGIVVFALALARLVWRFSNPAPTLPENMGALERLAAHLGHAGLYALMLFLPLSGWLVVSSSPYNIPTLLFGSINIPHMPLGWAVAEKTSLSDPASLIHEYAAYLLIVLVLLHIAAALKHHFISKDDVLVRMMKPSSAAPSEASKQQSPSQSKAT
ncbi:cytochrome b [Rhodobacteraceae bacterium RKSG542]|uniref:cytochrome b n=1 Tax=Pseudovibrio flavus TaxID=2529854 RepID=UPI0012BCCBAF|nr:cytochrome b [Pseudovibrio flavus]MTI16960.1 cytochrome b [Pseudovibrio flavus]